MSSAKPTPHLVIFGAGYVGGEVARQALARGYRVTALTRNADKARALADVGVHVIVDDLASENWHLNLPDGADFVLNCVSSGGGGPEGYRHSYVEGMRSILEWASQVPVGTLVYTSSTSVYPQDGGVRVGEDAPIDETRASGSAIVESEDLLLAASGGGGGANGGEKSAHTTGSADGVARPEATTASSSAHGSGAQLHSPARSFILRLAGIYGPDRHYLLDQLRAGAGEVAGFGDHRLNLIHLDDITSAIWAAFDAPHEIHGGIFNVADDGAARKSEVAEFLAQKLGLPAPHFTGEPAQGRRRITPDRVIANDQIKRILGWHPRHPTYRQGYATFLK